MAIPVPGVGGGAGLNQLAELYRQQVMSGGGTEGVAGGAEAKAAQARSADFADAIGKSMANLASLDATAQSKAVGAATGDLNDIHDYVIAATEAQTATELTTTVRNKALESFNEIMRMPL